MMKHFTAQKSAGRILSAHSAMVKVFFEFVHVCRENLTANIIAAIVYDDPNKNDLFTEVKEDYHRFLEDFMDEYFMEMDEEELKDCSWFYGEIH